MATNWKRITFPLLTLPVTVGSVKMSGACELFQTLFFLSEYKRKKAVWLHETIFQSGCQSIIHCHMCSLLLTCESTESRMLNKHESEQIK